MPISLQKKDELLEIIYRLGGDQIRKNIWLPEAKIHCPDWDKDTFWDTAQALIDEEFLILRNIKGWVGMTLEGRKRVEDQLNPPAIHTYNVISAGTVTNSPIQQGGSGSDQHQVVTYTTQQQQDLTHLVNLLEENLHQLQIEPQQKRKAEAQIATLKAQLVDEPDPIIVKQAGRTLRNITEGAIGSLIATAAQPAVWPIVSEIMTKLF